MIDKRVVDVIRAVGSETNAPQEIVEAVVRDALPSIRLVAQFPRKGWRRSDAQVQPRRSQDQERKGPADSRRLVGVGPRGCGETWCASSGKVNPR